MDCPYRHMCNRYPDCPNDCKDCELFNNFMRKEAEKDIRPAKWEPGPRE